MFKIKKENNVRMFKNEKESSIYKPGKARVHCLKRKESEQYVKYKRQEKNR